MGESTGARCFAMLSDKPVDKNRVDKIKKGRRLGRTWLNQSRSPFFAPERAEEGNSSRQHKKESIAPFTRQEREITDKAMERSHLELVIGKSI